MFGKPRLRAERLRLGCDIRAVERVVDIRLCRELIATQLEALLDRDVDLVPSLQIQRPRSASAEPGSACVRLPFGNAEAGMFQTTCVSLPAKLTTVPLNSIP